MMSTTVNIVAAADTILSGGSAATKLYNYGNRTPLVFRANEIHGVLRFNLSGIPSSATIVSASLKLTQERAHAVGNVYNWFQVAAANADWIEGTRNATQALSGEPCWNAKKANGSGGVATAWAGSAGCATAGMDYVNTIIATLTLAAAGANGTVQEIPFNASGLAVVQSWFGALTNEGIFSKGVSGYAFYHSREAVTAAYRPVLSVTYDEGASSYRHKPVSQLTGSIRQLGT